MSFSHILFCCMLPCRSDQVRVFVSCAYGGRCILSDVDPRKGSVDLSV